MQCFFGEHLLSPSPYLLTVNDRHAFVLIGCWWTFDQELARGALLHNILFHWLPQTIINVCFNEIFNEIDEAFCQKRVHAQESLFPSLRNVVSVIYDNVRTQLTQYRLQQIPVVFHLIHCGHLHASILESQAAHVLDIVVVRTGILIESKDVAAGEKPRPHCESCAFENPNFRHCGNIARFQEGRHILCIDGRIVVAKQRHAITTDITMIGLATREEFLGADELILGDAGSRLRE